MIDDRVYCVVADFEAPRVASVWLDAGRYSTREHRGAVAVDGNPSQAGPAAVISTGMYLVSSPRTGLIRREPNPADARSTMVCLLPAGRAAIEKAAPGHVADVRRNFIDLLTPAELDMLATLNKRILHHLAKDDHSPAEDEPL